MTDKRITSGGQIPLPGQTSAPTIILHQTKRFDIDIQDFVDAVRSYEGIDFQRRYKLFDLYSDILIDTHLSSVIGKRHDAISESPITFLRNGKPDDRVLEQINAPWFDDMIRDILDTQFWGFSLLQFHKVNGWIGYDLVPRKNVDPVRRIILHQQTDVINGYPFDDYPNLLFLGSERGLGDLAKAAPWVIYKRNNIADWAQFAEVFGMPLREYVYDEDDEESRQRAVDDAKNQGALAVFIHGKDTTMNLVDSQSKAASADLYARLKDTANAEISKLFLGGTLTTESSTVGTQALGKVHSDEENKKLKSDRRYILRVLNYEMTDIFSKLGINTTGGKFCFVEPKNIDLTAKMNILVQARTTFNLPVGDDYLYETFGIDRPDDYDDLKSKMEQDRKDRLAAASQQKAGDEEGDEGGDGDNKSKAKPIDNQTKGKSKLSDKSEKNFFARLRDFFSDAPHHGGALEW
jgi:phage gp29-like protein